MSIDEDNVKLNNFRFKLNEEEVCMKKVAFEIKKRSFPRPSKDHLLTEYVFRQAHTLSEQNKLTNTTNYITTNRHSSLETDLNHLKPIQLKDMTVNKIHLGYYLECKSVSKTFYSPGMNLLVQDNSGDVEHLILYNYEPMSFNTEPDILIPIGSKLVIKEPHLQMISVKDFCIRVDSPTDVLISYSLDKTLTSKSVDQLIDEGNKAFLKSKFHNAIRLYTQAIEKSEKKSSRAYLNRSQCYLKQTKYYSAFQDASQAICLDEKNEKAYFRQARSAYLMRKFETALKCYETCLNLNPQNKEAQVEIDRTLKRINESKTGNDNFSGLYEQFLKRDELHMDVADFMSEKIAITDIENKAKGVVACEFIEKGTLLIVSKAESAVFHNKSDCSKLKGYSKVDYYESSFTGREEMEMITNLAYKMQDNPELAQKMYTLYSGDEFDRNQQVNVIDFKRIEGFQKYNSFQIQNAFETLQLHNLNMQTKKFKNYKEYRELDLAAVNLSSEYFVSMKDLQCKINNLDRQYGIWFMPSHFNHSCIPNSVIDFIGDVMTIYSSRDIQKGEEVTIKYFPPDISFSQRCEYSTNKYNFKCDCCLCQLDRTDDLVTKRDELLHKIVMKNSMSPVSINELIANLETMRSTYSKRLKHQLHLIIPLVFLALKHRKSGSFKKSAACFESVFDTVKDSNDFYAITALKEAYNDFVSCSQPKQSEQCKLKAFNYFSQIYRYKPCFDALWNEMHFISSFNGFMLLI